MRKILLLSFMLPVAAFAQNLVNGNSESAKASWPINGEKSIVSPVEVIDNHKPKGPSTSKAEWLYKAVQIGETQYDLQVNSALANRVQVHSDGSVSAVFTMASDPSPFLTRGTGYAHFDGSNWSDMPLSRLEDDRSGWCNIGTVEKDGNTVEFVVSHHASADANAQSGGLYLIMNDAVGSNNWSIVEKLEVGADGPFWPRAVGSGSYIHIYTAANTSTSKTIEGIRRPNSYYRYDVSTSTWLDEQVIMDGYADSVVAFGWSDAYQMDVDGDNIAIVTGGSGQTIFLFKSNDNGDSWTTTVVDEFPIPGFDGNQVT
ncbi:MAG: hypothetical protein ACPGLV_13090, partial [Bacteroidia bacterium]